MLNMRIMKEKPPPVDKESLAILGFIHRHLDKYKEGGAELQNLASKAFTSPPTISRLRKPPDPDYHPSFDIVYRVLAECLGKFPMRVEQNELLTNLPAYAKGNVIINELVKGVAGLTPSDVDLLFQFLAVLKNRASLDSIFFGTLIGALAMLTKEIKSHLGPQESPPLISQEDNDNEQDINKLN